MAGVNHDTRVHHMSVHSGSDPFANSRADDFRSAVIRSPYFPTVMGTTDPSFIDYLLGEPAEVQVALDVSLDGTTVRIKAKVEVVGDYDATKENGCAVFIDGQQVNVVDNKSLNLGIYLIEDNLVHPQANYGTFTHMNVMRDYLTEFAQGDELTGFGEEVTMGQSFCRTYEYDLAANSYHEDVSNCKILALVVEGNRCEMSETEWYLGFLGSDVVELGSL
jgi:hypothetical protein